LIVDDLKWIECRKGNCKIRERVGIIQAGTGTIIGEVDIVGSFKFTEDQKKELQPLHRVDDLSLLDNWGWGWKLENAIRYDKPKKYTHKKGAQLWVKL
jgi:hypothetical protein